MRKHFLILMLMALLPMAGWAAIDITNYRVTVATDNYVYDGNAVEIVPNVVNENLTDPQPLHYNTDGFEDDYELYYYSYDEATQELTKLDAAPSTVGSYVVKAHGIGDYSGITSTGAGFIIRKAELQITIGDGDYFTKSYLTADPAMPAIDEWTFAIENEEIDNEEGQAMLKNQTPSYSHSGVNAKAAGYDITWNGIELKDNLKDNYELDIIARKMVITPINIVVGEEATVTVDPEATAGKTYDGVKYQPTYTLTYAYGEGDNDKYTLNANSASDYVLKYYPVTFDEDVPTMGETPVAEPINAGTYWCMVSAGTSGNFTTLEFVPGGVVEEPGDGPAVEPGEEEEGEWVETLVKVGEFTIEPKNVTIAVNPNTKTYDGISYDLEDAVFTIGDLASVDEGKLENLAAKFNDALMEDFPENGGVGSWSIGVDYDAATIEGTPLTTNYTVTALSSTWKIKKHALKVSAMDKTATLNDPVPVSEVVVEKALNDDEKAIIAAGFKIENAEGLSTEAYGKIDNAYIISEKAAGDFGQEANPTYEQVQAVLANYVDIVTAAEAAEDEQLTQNLFNGSLTVTGGPFTVIPMVANNIPYGTAIEPEILAYVVYGEDDPQALEEDEDYQAVDAEAGYAFKYKLSTDADEADNWKPLTANTKFDVNTTYNIKVDETSIEGIGNFEGGVVTASVVTFNIVPKLVKYQISNVTLHEGDTKSNLNEGINKATATLVAGYSLADGESLEFEYDFAEGITGLEVDEETGKISIGEGFEDGNNEAITATVKAGDFKDNYTVEFIKGNLSIADAELVIDPTDADLLAKIDDADTNGSDYDVVIKTGRKLYGGYWNMLVLPFDVEPYEFCNDIKQYAVFNTLYSANPEKNTVSFKLALETIPANTPFLVKPVEDVEFTIPAEEEEADPTYFIFENKQIVFGDPIQTKKNVKFVGTYTGLTDVEGGENVLYMFADNDGHPTIGPATWKGQAYNIESIPSTSAYLIVSDEFTAAPVITVEELDGSTTAISSVTANGSAVKAEGWYTIDGIRLQGAPTEKGVYINNGKKVVIK